MPNDNDNKLVTLADLGEAYSALYARDVMDASDKTKLDGIEAGAQVNTVTSVNSQTGAVSITPANIGAVDAAMLIINTWGVNGESILANNGIYARSYNHNILPSQGVPTGFSEYASVLSVIGPKYPIAAYIDVFGNLAIWNSNQNRWEVYHRGDYVYGITEGGTGATTPAGARTNLQINSGQRVAHFDNGVLTYSPSELGLDAGQPSVIIMTPCNIQCNLRYDWDHSVSNIILHANYPDGTPITGIIRFSFIAIP